MRDRVIKTAEKYAQRDNLSRALTYSERMDMTHYLNGWDACLAEVLKELRGPVASNRCREQDVKQYHYHSTDWADWLSNRFKGE